MKIERMENLIAGHAYWSDKIRKLKTDGAKEAERCDRIVDYVISNKPFPKTCIEDAFDSKKEQFDPYYGGPEFNEVWDEMIEEGEICQHCINVRSLKRERMIASRRLGCIRAAMTKIGRKLKYTDNLK